MVTVRWATCFLLLKSEFKGLNLWKIASGRSAHDSSSGRRFYSENHGKNLRFLRPSDLNRLRLFSAAFMGLVKIKIWEMLKFSTQSELLFHTEQGRIYGPFGSGFTKNIKKADFGPLKTFELFRHSRKFL